MIRIRIGGAPDKLEGFIIWGHARTAPYGEDIVCAGVSAVATTALIGMAKLIPGGVRYGISAQGLLYCKLAGTLPEGASRDAQTILTVMLLGLRAIRRNHRQAVHIAYRR